MTFRLGGLSRSSFPFTYLFVLSTTSAFADTASNTASLSTNIITAGFVGFALLALYVAFLTMTFIIKSLKESAKARKEAAAQAAHVEHKAEGRPFLSLVTWIGGAFALVAVLSLFIVGFMALIEADLSSTTSISSLLITVGVAGFACLAFYVVYLTGMFIWKALKGVSEVEAHAPARAPVPAAQAAVAGVPLAGQVTRRSFLSLLGWAWVAFTAATMGAVSTMLRFAFPNVTFEPPSKFKCGFPANFKVGVDERFKDEFRVWIVRTETQFYALSTICTHLGCTPNWLQAEQKFKCPCHGSGFYPSGVNFEGPAPRPLERFQIALGDDGQIVVDKNVKFQQELGQWGLPGSFLDYKA